MLTGSAAGDVGGERDHGCMAQKLYQRRRQAKEYQLELRIDREQFGAKDNGSQDHPCPPRHIALLLQAADARANDRGEAGLNGG